MRVHYRLPCLSLPPLFVLSAFLETLADNPRSRGGGGKKSNTAVGRCAPRRSLYIYRQKKVRSHARLHPEVRHKNMSSLRRNRQHKVPKGFSLKMRKETKTNQHCTNGKSAKIINLSLQPRCHVDVMLNVYSIYIK